MLFVSIRLSVRGHRCINLDDGLTFSKNPECEDTCGCVNTDTYITSHAQSIGALLFIFAARLSKETKLTHKSAGEYVSVFYEATHLWLVIGVLHIWGKDASVKPTESLEMSDLIVPVLILWL